MHIFPKIVLITKKGPLKMTSTMFLFRQEEELAVFHLLPNLTVSGDFMWDDCLLVMK